MMIFPYYCIYTDVWQTFVNLTTCYREFNKLSYSAFAAATTALSVSAVEECPILALQAIQIFLETLEPHDPRTAGGERVPGQNMLDDALYSAKILFKAVRKFSGGYDAGNSGWCSHSNVIFSFDRFAALIARLDRKIKMTNDLQELGYEVPIPRETAVPEAYIDPFFCLCMLYYEGQETLRRTLESYEEGGLLSWARRKFLIDVRGRKVDHLALPDGFEVLKQDMFPQTFTPRYNRTQPGKAMSHEKVARRGCCATGEICGYGALKTQSAIRTTILRIPYCAPA
eukprot:GEMP01053812.1.p1 GENE.GEMP01053812.1~~GEMP01053812.1.p1  ORF type:complete len:284 (+),score=24.92 GEMP01053812.1:77-928(+)